MKSEKEFEKFFKSLRKTAFRKPYELVYEAFLGLGLDKKSQDEFRNNASEYVVALRDKCWADFQAEENAFKKQVYRSLITEDYRKLDGVEAIEKFIDDHSSKFYTLSLSNTQSRRSRAGAEFEAIIEFVLLGAGCRMDSQGSLSSGLFARNELGKAVDLVVPNVVAYSKRKSKVALVSCKTTLRERWQEVVEEKGRTGAAEVYLVTLDEGISRETIDNLVANNIYIVTLKSLVNTRYLASESVLSLEEFLGELTDKIAYWDPSRFDSDELDLQISRLLEQRDAHMNAGRPFMVEKYESFIKDLQDPSGD